MKFLKISLLTSLVLLSTGCSTVTNAFTDTFSFVSKSQSQLVEEPKFVGNQVVDMENANNIYGYPYGYFQVKPQYTTPGVVVSPPVPPPVVVINPNIGINPISNPEPNLGLKSGKEIGDWYRPKSQFYESQIPHGYVDNTNHHILEEKTVK